MLSDIYFAVSYSYDANGNTLTDAQGRSYTWDFENRLTQTVNPGVGTTTFKYDPLGRRIQKSSPLGTMNYLYDGANIVEEMDNTGSVLARYAQGLGVDQPLSEYRSGSASYYEADGLGSTTSLTNASATTAATYAYDTYGNLSGSTGSITNPFRYTGREFDLETGIYHYRARYYDPKRGYINEDPSNVGGGQYLYVGNSPTDLTDPSGLDAQSDQMNMVANAIQTLINLLPKDPGCLSWLCSNRKDEDGNDRLMPLDFLSQLLNFNTYGIAPIQPTENNNGSNGSTLNIINGQTPGVMPGQAITINSLGAAFNSTYASPSTGITYSLSTNNGRIPGGSNAALGFILLHELGHNMGVLAHDHGDDAAGRNNNNLITKHCKTLIHLLGK